MTVIEALRGARAALAASGILSAELDAALILAHVLGVERWRLRTESSRELSAAEHAEFDRRVAERARRRPIAQIVGRKEFRSLEFEVTGDVLTPRPETEMLVDAAVAAGDRAISEGRVPVVVDVGTGTGCIAIAVAVERPTAIVHATDASSAALAVAARNAARHGVTGRVTFHRGDLLAPIAAALGPASVDVVVSNPPYVERSEAGECDPEVLWEPACAVFCDGPPAGLYARIASDAALLVRAGGTLAMELPGTRSDPVEAAIQELAGWVRVDRTFDESGLPRVVTAVRTVLPRPWERVHTMTEYYDGPRRGVADFDGRPHVYESEWEDGADIDAEGFRLSPIAEDLLRLELESWAIWRRWETAHAEGRADPGSHPALPEDRARHEELSLVLSQRVVVDRERARRARAEWRAVTDPAWSGHGWSPLEVRWEPI